LHEIEALQIPLIGLVDTDMNPNKFLYRFFGNNDAFENINFLFFFLKEPILQGRLKEQKQFYFANDSQS